MRVSRHPNAIWIHAAVQTFGYVVFVTAAGLGIWMAKKVHAVRQPRKSNLLVPRPCKANSFALS